MMHVRTGRYRYQITPTNKMSAEAGPKSSDPYVEKNQEEPSLHEKVQELGAFVDKCKFCMMTTKSSDGVLASRCMALAAKVRPLRYYNAMYLALILSHIAGRQRRRLHLPRQF